jgi:hypothetical protein
LFLFVCVGVSPWRFLHPKSVASSASCTRRLGPDSKESERETARKRINELLAEYGRTWNDIPEILAAVRDAPPLPPSDQPADQPDQPQDQRINAFDLVRHLLMRHIFLSSEEEYTAIALWILHTWTFHGFTVSPRLALVSPVRGCGKTETLALIEQLVENPWRADDVTPASIYRQSHLPVYLLDEFDQANLRHNPTLKAVLHSGWREGGSISRFIGGWPRRFPVYTPVALAAIGAHSLSLPLLDRSVTINMHKAPPDAPIEKLGPSSPDWGRAKALISQWVRTAQLNPDPDMAGLTNRPADNWRILFSIADSLGAGEEARAAALKLKANRADVDPPVALLHDIRIIFWQRGVDRIASVELVAALHELDDFWADWDDHQPGRKLTQTHMARLLRGFHIRSKTVWPLGRASSSARSRRGYTIDQFQNAWRQYCAEGDTTTQRSKITRLVGK